MSEQNVTGQFDEQQLREFMRALLAVSYLIFRKYRAATW